LALVPSFDVLVLWGDTLIDAAPRDFLLA